MRLKSEIWIQAYLRRVHAAGAAAYVMRRGDRDAGAILIAVTSRDGTRLFAPGPSWQAPEGERRFAERVGASPSSGDLVAEVIGRETAIDPDVWVLEIEDRDGRHFLDDALDEG